MTTRLLVTPLADGAYFNEVIDVALAELKAVAGLEGTPRTVGPLRFIDVDAAPEQLPRLARLSWVQGLFRDSDPLPIEADLALPRPFLWGNKYAGKTNELATQLALNLALAHCSLPEKHRRVFDPMAGRGTTLLWAAAYGLDAVGIERDRSCVDHLHRHIKRQCKLHRVSHKSHLGQVGKKNRADVGRLGRYTFEDAAIELIVGDSADSPSLLGDRRVGLIVADAPYGIGHTAADGSRNPLAELEQAVPVWLQTLRPGGSGAIVFNALQPKRADLVGLFTQHGAQSVECDVSHRMSESILRDVVVFTKP